MAFDRMAGGHRFDFSRGVCHLCGMLREKFEDRGRPRFTGKPPDEKIRLTAPPDDGPPRPYTIETSIPPDDHLIPADLDRAV
jgi:hypothetical protein